MAQAARLNLRMQKELKLLLSDPPLGASFPHLSAAASASASDTDLSSPFLSSIDAEIQGPEGTVYGGGIFKLKIQIPDRYPFQPPIVTFATPIYHPNIDNGGRICLDILNLPPKGAWQPSLNISTLITSIALLLTEPNPDDGLMCKASKEYKYNRQAFDLKARTMTEKYAKPGSDGSGSSSDCCQKRKIGLREGKEGHGSETYKESKCAANSNKPLNLNEHVVRRKLSLVASRPDLKENDQAIGEITAAANYRPPDTYQKLSIETSAGAVEEDGQHELTKAINFETFGFRRKLSLHSSSQAMKREAHGGVNNENFPPSLTHETEKEKQDDNQHGQFNQSGDFFHLSGSKLCLSKRKLSLNRFDVPKE